MSKFLSAYKQEMSAKLDGTRPGYANLKHLNAGNISPDNSDEDDLDEPADLEDLLAQNNTQGPQIDPNIIFCAIFSFSGFALLLFVGFLLASDSLYIRAQPPEGKSKSSLALSVFLAALLYLCLFGVSMMYYQRARRAQKVYQLSLDIHAD